MKSALTTAFGRQLKSALAASGVRQKELAARLGLTASAVSQIVNGILMPSRENLDKMMRYLGDTPEGDALPALWQRVRLGDKEVVSRINRVLRNARRRRKLSVIQLADLCGLAADRIRRLETDPDALPLESEIAVLTAILPVAPEKLHPHRADFCYSAEATPIWMAADSGAELPLISEDALTRYDGKENFTLFSAREARRTLPCGRPELGAVAAVSLDASLLGFDADGTLLVLLGDENGESDNGFFLAPAAEKWRLTSGKNLHDVAWKLPVPEVIFYPARHDFADKEG